jgi:YggT family protein
MSLLVFLLIRLLDIYIWTIIVTVMISWLIVFGVLNMRNKGVAKVCRFLDSLTRPPTQFLQRYIPPVGGIDLTPMILIFGIYIIQGLLYGLL